MTENELIKTLESSDSHEAITLLGNRFVSSTMTNVEAFWEGEDIRREFYSILAVLHHANANGLEALIDYNERLWVPVTAYAAKIIEELEASGLETAISRFEALIAENFNPSPGAKLPRNASQLKELQTNAEKQGLEWTEQVGDDLSEAGKAFIGCANGALTEKVAKWMKLNASRIAPLIGQDKQAHRLMTNGVPGVKEGMNQRILGNPDYLGAGQSDRARMIVQYYSDEGETAMELAAKAWFQSHGILP